MGKVRMEFPIGLIIFTLAGAMASGTESEVNCSGFLSFKGNKVTLDDKVRANKALHIVEWMESCSNTQVIPQCCASDLLQNYDTALADIVKEVRKTIDNIKKAHSEGYTTYADIEFQKDKLNLNTHRRALLNYHEDSKTDAHGKLKVEQMCYDMWSILTNLDASSTQTNLYWLSYLGKLGTMYGAHLAHSHCERSITEAAADKKH